VKPLACLRLKPLVTFVNSALRQDFHLIKIDNLTKMFGGLTAVDGLSFEVRDGEVVGLLGPNGAGKTTTIRCIAGLLNPSKGSVIIDGHDIVLEAEDAKRAFAYVPEIPNAYDLLTVLEHLRVVSAAYGTEDEMANAEAILRRLDIWDKRHALAASLSKGMKQKLACACAFIHRARNFCLDEPFIGLDPKGARELKDMILDQRSAGMAVLVSTHQLEVAERLCDRVLIMNHGAMIAQGTVGELRDRMRSSDSTLEEMFLKLTEFAEDQTEELESAGV
jgi:ABC-2 type transport system ATP-binding protein